MADVLSTGLSSLRALQRALDTTSHNIANVSTEGYTRQRVEFQTRQPEMSGGGWIGTGVETSTVRRVYDQFLAQQTRSSGTNLARLDAFASQAARIDNLLGDSANGLSSSLQSFTDAINEVSTTPASIPARQVLIAEGRALAERLKSYDTRMRDMSAEVNGRLSVEAQEITTLAQGIAKLNGDISVAFQQSGQPPNDLLDQRDALINELSGKVACRSSPKAMPHSTYSSAMASRWCSATWPRRSPRRWIRSIRNAHCCRMRTPARAPWTCHAWCPAERSAACSTGAARCSTRRATSSAASASPSRPR